MSRNRAHNRPQLVKSKPIGSSSNGTAVLDWKPGKQAIDAPVLIPLDNEIRPILREARNNKSGKSRAFSFAWDETEALGITADMRRSGPGMLSDADRKDTLYKAYLNSVWISACVDVIAKRITSGGMVIDLTENGKENQTEYDTLHEFLHFINDDEDFLHLIRSIATDMLIYGEAYMEIVTKGGKPFSLHKIDCATMNYQLDQHGMVVKYIQNMTHSTQTVDFQPNEVIRWWLADPRAGKKALSPIERILGPVDADVHMADWVRSFFRKGARPNFWIKFPGSLEEANRFVTWLRENYTGAANAHVPLVLFDEAELYEIGKGSVDVDFLKGREAMCKEILAAYGVPPALVGLIESGNIGGGTGESQEKSFLRNACDPIRERIFESFNYFIVQKGFGITNYKVSTRYADYRADDAVSKIQDMRIRNGSNTVNEVRSELGKPPVDGGDEAVVVASRDIVPVQRLQDMAQEQRDTAAASVEQAQANADLATTKAKQAKEPPSPVPAQLPPGTPLAPAQQKQQPSGNEQAQAAERSLLHAQLSGLIERLERQTRTEDVRHEAAQLLNDLLSQPRPHVEDEPAPRIAERMDALEEQLRVFRAQDITPRKPRTRRKAEPKPATPVRPITEAEQHTGVMVAFMLDPEVAHRIALPGGEPENDLHITLAYLGDLDDAGLDIPAHLPELQQALHDFAIDRSPLQGKIAGIGRFKALEDEPTPVIALPDIPDLPTFRQDLVNMLAQIGCPANGEHGYQPHVTLAYIDASAPMPVDSIPELPLAFYGITLAVGNERFYYPFGGPYESRAQQDPQAIPDDAGDSGSERSEVQSETSGPAEADPTGDPGITEQQTSGAHERLKQWREPGPEQLELEVELKRLLKRLRFTKDSQPSQEDKEAIAQQVATLLDRAKTIGRAHATDKTQEDGAWGGKFVNLLQSAWDIVTNFVDRVAGWISGQDLEGLTEEDIVAEVDAEAGLVGDVEIAAAIESAVVDELQSQGFMTVRWLAQPDACKLCRANADQGPVPIGTAFVSGDAIPPAHGNCRCSIGSGSEED